MTQETAMLDNDTLASYLSGEGVPASAAALMQARYYAYTKCDVDYIYKTTHPKERDSIDLDHVKEWARKSEWLGLEIVSTEGGESGDTNGVVEFIATYKNNQETHRHHERSTFEYKDNQWFFIDGEMVGLEPIKNEAPKVGRNDPCSCGSGKKFKKCCALK